MVQSKIQETKWFDVKWKPLYSYRIRSSKITEQIEQEMKLTCEQGMKLTCDEKFDNVIIPKNLPPKVAVPPPIHPRERLKKKTQYKETFTFQ